MSPRIKNSALIVILIALIFIAYSLFLRGEDNDELLVSQGAAHTEGSTGAVSEFLLLLQTLNRLRLDTSIFNDIAYRSLRDESVELVGQPRGRTNPFAPLQ